MKLCLYGKKSNKRWTTDMMKHAKEITMRHEEKYLCSESYLRILESRLQGFLSPDSNQDELGYEIRSLYFDTATERLYEEGLAGLEHRNKYRMRIYNGDSDVIKLEKKTSIRNLKKKDTIRVEKNYVDSVLFGNEVEEVLKYEDGSLMQEFTLLRKIELLRPKVIVSYQRKAFVSDIGNIRITLDENIRATDKVEGFFEKDTTYFPILPAGIHLLEVKYDGILPGYLVRLINFANLERTSFSKYVLSMDMMKNNGRMSGLYEF